METTTANISAEIKSANKKFMQAFTEGNAASIANLYTADGVLLPAGTEAIKGKQGIQEFWKGAMNMGIKAVKLETLEVQPCENTAIEMGNYTLSGEGGSMVDKGNRDLAKAERRLEAAKGHLEYQPKCYLRYKL